MAIGSDIGGVVSAVLNKSNVPNAPDLTQLFQTIDNAGAYQQQIINALPAELQQQYATYQKANAATENQLQTGVSQLGQNLLTQTAANYGPNAPAVTAAETAANTNIAANIPAQQAAIRQALAATGGLQRGTAAKQLAAPVVQAAAQTNQATENISANQLQQQQAAMQSAINTVNSMNDQTLQSLFGLNQQQALQILTGTRQDLSNQLTQLINQSVNQTNQTLGVQGANIQNQATQAAQMGAAQSNVNNALTNLGGNEVNSLTNLGGNGGGISGMLQGLNQAPAGYTSGYSGSEMGVNGQY